MAEIIIYGDVEWAVAQEIAALAAQHDIALKPYGGSTDRFLAGDSVQAVAIGGAEVEVAVGTVLMDLDVRATTEARAVYLGGVVHGIALALGRSQILRDGVGVVAARSVNFPYLMPDPQNPELHRVVVKVEFTVKGVAL